MSRTRAGWALLVALCVTPVTLWAKAGPLPATLRIGYLSERVERSTAYMAPGLEKLAAALAPRGVKDVELKIGSSVGQIGQWLLEGAVHVFVSTPYPILQIERRTGLSPRLHGVPIRPQKAVFLARRGGPVAGMDDLAGHSLAFTMTFSSPGYFMPRVHLVDRGYRLDREGEDGSIRTVFSGSGLNSLYWLFFERVDAAVVAEETFEEAPAPLAEKLVVLGSTRPSPGVLIVVSPALGELGSASLEEALQHFHEGEGGRALLESAYGCSRFAPLDAEVLEWISWARPLLPTPRPAESP